MITAITMVKNEADILPYTLEHLKTQHVDHCYALDNLSDDTTSQILAEHAPWVTVIPDDEYGYYQSRKMSDLAQHAYEQGATWIIPFDADELIWHPEHTIGSYLKTLPDTVSTVRIQCWDYLPRIDMPNNPDPYRKFAWRRPNPQPYPKIVFRAVPDPHIHMGNHGVDHVPGETIDGLQIRHIQYRSLEQMTRKLRNGKAVYDATSLDQGQGAHWRQGGALTDTELAHKWSQLVAEPAIYDPYQ
jgi:glycosyltransferase involved in cell wall biosynthesis